MLRKILDELRGNGPLKWKLVLFLLFLAVFMYLAVTAAFGAGPGFRVKAPMFALVAATTLSLNLIVTNTPKRPAAQFLDGQTGLLAAVASVSAATSWLAGEEDASELYLFLAMGLGIVAGAVIFVSGYTMTRDLFAK